MNGAAWFFSVFAVVIFIGFCCYDWWCRDRLSTGRVISAWKFRMVKRYTQNMEWVYSIEYKRWPISLWEELEGGTSGAERIVMDRYLVLAANKGNRVLL